MRQHITNAAKSLITIIGTEYLLAESRVARGYIKRDQMLGTLYERLNRLSVDNHSLRRFLDDIGHIPHEEDEDTDLPWAKDPREERDNEVVGKRRPPARSQFGNRSNRLTRILSGD